MRASTCWERLILLTHGFILTSVVSQMGLEPIAHTLKGYCATVAPLARVVGFSQYEEPYNLYCDQFISFVDKPWCLHVVRPNFNFLSFITNNHRYWLSIWQEFS